MTKENDRDLDAKVVEVKENLKALSESLYGLTGESLNEINNVAKTLFDDEWVRSTFKDPWKDNWQDKWVADWKEEWKDNWRERTGWIKDLKNSWNYPPVYQSHDNEGSNIGIGCRHKAFDFYKQHIYKWYGLVEQGAPSVRKYNECVDKNGQQLYDSNGFWRCLFPNSEISNRALEYKKEKFADLILTKEDFLDEVDKRGTDLKADKYDFGEKGIFFKQFEDMMNWKSIMEKNIRNQREEMRKKKRQEWEQKKQEWEQKKEEWKENQKDQIEPLNSSELVTSEFDPSKKVVSTTVESMYTYENNNIVQNETRTEYYDDGTSFTKTVTKRKPDGQDWLIDTTESSNNDSTKGWFWNR